MTSAKEDREFIAEMISRECSCNRELFGGSNEVSRSYSAPEVE